MKLAPTPNHSRGQHTLLLGLSFSLVLLHPGPEARAGTPSDTRAVSISGVTENRFISVEARVDTTLFGTNKVARDVFKTTHRPATVLERPTIAMSVWLVPQGELGRKLGVQILTSGDLTVDEFDDSGHCLKKIMMKVPERIPDGTYKLRLNVQPAPGDQSLSNQEVLSSQMVLLEPRDGVKPPPPPSKPKDPPPPPSGERSAPIHTKLLAKDGPSQALTIKGGQGDRLFGTVSAPSPKDANLKLLIFGPDGSKLKKVDISGQATVSFLLPKTGSYRLEFRQIGKKVTVDLEVIPG